MLVLPDFDVLSEKRSDLDLLSDSDVFRLSDTELLKLSEPLSEDEWLKLSDCDSDSDSDFSVLAVSETEVTSLLSLW